MMNHCCYALLSLFCERRLYFLFMEFDLNRYLIEIDQLLVDSGAECEVFAEVGGFELKGYTITREGAPHVYLSTGMHGDEPAGPLALLALMRGGLLEKQFSFSICPCLNPTGLEIGTRENASEHGGIDLNRDYTLMESEEVRGHVKWLKRMPAGAPEVFISFHEDWESVGYYFYEINLGDDDVDRYNYIKHQVSKKLGMEASEEIDGHGVREQGWIYHAAEADLPSGWPEAIYMAKNGCPLSFTFESPSALDLATRVSAHVIAANSVLEYEYGN